MTIQISPSTSAPAHRFLEGLFGRVRDPRFTVLLWTTPGKETHLFGVHELNRAAEHAVGLGSDREVYIGVGLRPHGMRDRVRGGVADVVGIGGLWADVDVRKAGARRRYFASREAARRFLLNWLYPPTMLVWTGGGYHAWWLFPEAWLFEGPGDRMEAAACAAAWQRGLQRRAAAYGVEIDSTFDLARVLRVPGTVSHKHGVPVELEAITSRRYGHSDLIESLPGNLPDVSVGSRVPSDGLVLHPAAEPPATKFRALAARHPRFARTWRRDRRDLRDHSPSAFDLSLATMAACDGWSDQEVADLLIAHRRHHGDPAKLRADYLLRTISRARSTMRARRERKTFTVRVAS